jgi:LmbE family N-acetylglucosaminyl deacetylase
MDWVYLSPHLDDVALSLGGLIWEQTQAGQQVSVWTICAGNPPPGDFSPFTETLHKRWGVGREAMEERRAEDIQSCRRLGAEYFHLDIPDCIYRRSPKTGRHLYDSEELLWVPVHPDEEDLIDEISKKLQSMIHEGAKLVCPLAFGDHVDHRLTQAAAERLEIPLLYYAEFPYVYDEDVFRVLENFQSTVSPISTDGILAWQKSIQAHRSQISTFWDNLNEMRRGIQDFHDQMGGIWVGKSART